ncbi:MAG: cytidine deaminase [Chloroflexi bacterium]|nr:cytidine deaminase [Chloroflexota bacterium]
MLPSVDALLAAARAAAGRAYAPYSHFRVGAALLDADGGMHLGCNVESASYGLTNCAERTAIFSAVAVGARRPFVAMAIVCPDAPPAGGADGCSPCGACRQVMVEHFASEAPVVLDGNGSFTVHELLPHSFRLG